MTASDTENRRYRFGQRDRAGWLLGLQASQCIGLGAGILAAGVLLNVGVALPFVLGPLIMSSWFAFGSVNGRPIHEQSPRGHRLDHGACRRCDDVARTATSLPASRSRPT